MKLLYEPVCPSLSHSLSQSVTNDFFVSLISSHITFRELIWLHTKCLYASKLLYEPICHSLSHSLSQSVNNNFCLLYIFQNNGHRPYVTKYKMCVYFKSPLWTCLSFTQSLIQSVSQSLTIFVCLISSKLTFRGLTWQNTKYLYDSKPLCEPVCPSPSHSLSQSVTNIFLPALYLAK